MARRLSRTTTDHDEIRSWAEARGGSPAEVADTQRGGEDTGIIRIDFPGHSGEGKLRPIAWDEWFRKFDEANLALVIQEETAAGERSNFNKLVSREGSPRRARARSGAARSRSRPGRASVRGRAAKRSAAGRGRSSGRRETAARTASRTTSRKRSAAGAAGGRATAARRGGRTSGARASSRAGKAGGSRRTSGARVARRGAKR